MTTHACPTCRHWHEPPTFTTTAVALASIAQEAEKTGAQITDFSMVPGAISVSVKTEDGLRALASHLGLPEPSWDGSFLETRGSYAGANVTLHHYAGAAS